MNRSTAASLLAFFASGITLFGQVIPIDCRDAAWPDVRHPLASAQVEVELAGLLAVTRWTLAFRNDTHAAAEGRLEVDLPAGWRVSGYALEVAGKMRAGVLVPRAKARAAYQEIVDRRVDPGILELTPSGFVTRIFPIPAGGTKAVRIELAWLRPDQGHPFPMPGADGKAVQWVIRCHDPEPPEQPGNEAAWRQKDGVWKALGTSPVAALAALRLQANAKTPTWAASGGPTLEWWVGRVPVSVHKEVRQPPKLLHLWWDGSLAGRNRDRKATIASLRKLIERMGEGDVVLRVFREVAAPAEGFAVRAGACDALCERLLTETPEGMARFDALEGGPDDGMVLVVSEGISPLPACRPRFADGVAFDVLDPGGKGGGVLGSHASRAGGEVRTPSEEDWAVRHPVPPQWRDGTAWTCRREGDSWIVATRGAAEHLDKPPGGVVRAPFARHAWAVERAREMEKLQVARRIRSDFAREERLLGADNALLVLETLEDYAQYGIEPPEPELRAGWLEARRKRLGAEPDPAKLLALWTEVWLGDQKGHEAPQTDYATRLATAIEETGKRWQRINKPPVEKITATELARLDELRAQTRDLRAEANDDGTRMRKLLGIGSEWESLVSAVNERLGTMSVVVGGQVYRPGPQEVPESSTITEAIEAAGGATPFGSLRRVKLFRSGKMTQFNLARNDAHKKVPLDPNDVVEVPQKMVWGDGGGGAEEKPARTPQGLAATLRTPEAAGKAPGLSAIAAMLDSGGDWKSAMRRAGRDCGWSVDSLRQVGALLENRNMKDEARRVAASLAQAAPDDPACLRRAAAVLGRTGDRETARRVLERLCELDPEDPMPWLELARLCRDAGQWPEAVRAYAAITEREWAPTQMRVWNCALTELNALLHRHGEALAAGLVDAKRVRPLAADFRLVAECDSELPLFAIRISSVDPFGNLISTGPSFWMAGSAPSTTGALFDLTIREAVPGTYVFKVFHYAAEIKPEPLRIIEADLFLNFGRANETRRRVFLKLERSGHTPLARVSWEPAD